MRSIMQNYVFTQKKEVWKDFLDKIHNDFNGLLQNYSEKECPTKIKA